MKYIFILGRNVDLSLAEIFSYFGKSENRILNYFVKENSALIELEKKLSEKIIGDFGGVIAIGEILASGSIREIISELQKKEIYSGTKNKLNYVIWNFADEESVNNISFFLKQKFKSEKLKATEKKLGGSMKLQEGEAVRYAYSGSLIEEQYVVFGEKNKFYFGKITEKCDYKDIESRDMEKPVRREELSISPRLAKIMINLSQAKKNQKIVDPFCGVGVILYEALLKEIKVIGIDKDKNAIAGARENLLWGKFLKSDYSLIRDDSSKVDIESAEAIVTEPHFGEILKKLPTKNQAKDMITRFENLMIAVINNLKKNVSGRIVFTAPTIKTMSKRVSCDPERILDKTGLKLAEIKNISVPIKEFRQNQIVGREIFILESKTRFKKDFY
jgi:tRNA G10  N-methylase Trm11